MPAAERLFVQIKSARGLLGRSPRCLIGRARAREIAGRHEVSDDLSEGRGVHVYVSLVRRRAGERHHVERGQQHRRTGRCGADPATGVSRTRT